MKKSLLIPLLTLVIIGLVNLFLLFAIYSDPVALNFGRAINSHKEIELLLVSMLYLGTAIGLSLGKRKAYILSAVLFGVNILALFAFIVQGKIGISTPFYAFLNIASLLGLYSSRKSFFPPKSTS